MSVDNCQLGVEHCPDHLAIEELLCTFLNLASFEVQFGQQFGIIWEFGSLNKSH